MTVGEIWAVLWAKTRESEQSADGLEELYQTLMEAQEE